jgi:hypothetical protein
MVEVVGREPKDAHPPRIVHAHKSSAHTGAGEKQANGGESFSGRDFQVDHQAESSQYSTLAAIATILPLPECIT